MEHNNPLFLVVLLLSALSVQAASFNCMNAHSLVDNAICRSPALSEMDVLMVNAYKNALASSQDAGAVQGAQRRWIAERNTCSNVGCLLKAYQSRIWQLLPPHERGAPWISGVYEAGRNKLDIIQTKPHEVRFRLFALSSNGNIGEIEGHGQLYDGVAKFVGKSVECNLTMHIKGKRIILSQIGYCGFGVNVTADGDYRLVDGKSPVILKSD